MKTFILFLLLFCFSESIAQRTAHSWRPQRYTIFEAGVLNGSQTAAFTMQGKIGVKLNQTLIGAGVGIDGYRLRSVPVFLDLQQEFGKKNTRFFAQANGGYNYAWVSEKNKMTENYWFGTYKGGTYYDAGVGVKLKMADRNFLVFSGGYSWKKMKKVYTTNYCPLNGTCFEMNDDNNYTFSRIVFRAGWQF